MSESYWLRLASAEDAEAIRVYQASGLAKEDAARDWHFDSPLAYSRRHQAIARAEFVAAKGDVERAPEWVGDIRAREKDGCAFVGEYREDIRDLLADRDALCNQLEVTRAQLSKSLGPRLDEMWQTLVGERDAAVLEARNLKKLHEESYEDTTEAHALLTKAGEPLYVDSAFGQELNIGQRVAGLIEERERLRTSLAEAFAAAAVGIIRAAEEGGIEAQTCAAFQRLAGIEPEGDDV